MTTQPGAHPQSVNRFCQILTGVGLMWCLMCGLAPVWAAQSDRAQVRIGSEILAEKDRLTLGDIAEIAASTPESDEALKSVSLGYSPRLGTVRELPRDRVLLAIQSAGFTDETVTVYAPPVILIRRAAQTIDLAYLKAAVEEAVLPDLEINGVTARLVRLDLPPVVQVPTGKTEIRAQVRNVRDIYYPFTVGIDIVVDSLVVRRFQATAQVEAFAAVLVANENLAAGQRLTRTVVSIAPCRLAQLIRLYFRDPGAVRGMALRKPVSKGSPITTDLVFPDTVIKPGDQVRIIGKTGTVTIEVMGEARTGGRIGDRIQVKNSQSGVILQATVVDEGMVQVVL